MYATSLPVQNTKPFRIPGDVTAFSTGDTHAIDVFQGKGNIYGVNLINLDATNGMVFRFYDMDAAAVNAMIVLSKFPKPRKTFIVSPGSPPTLPAGQLFLLGLDFPIHFGNNCCVRVTGLAPDNDVTNIATAPIMELEVSTPQTIVSQSTAS